MSLQTPLEGLLRPPVEWYTSLVSIAGAALLSTHTTLFLLPVSIVHVSSILLTGLFLARLKQGFRILKYQRNLKSLPKFLMSSSQVPVSQKQLFLGKGFLWTPVHTQRLRDLDLDYNLSYRTPSRMDRLFRLYPDIGGEPCLHGVSETENDVTMSLTERQGHTVVIGTTGVGKTRLAELLIAQDIRRGDVVIVIDPKGDADLLKRLYLDAKLAGREKDVLVFHLGFPAYSARYNPIGHFTKITQVATRITNALPSTGEAAAFKEFAWKYVNLTARALEAMHITPTYQLINFYITRLETLLARYCQSVMPDFKVWVDDYGSRHVQRNRKGEGVAPDKNKVVMAYVENILASRQQTSQSDLLSDLAAACGLDRTYYDKITASVGPLLEKLTTGKIAELLSPDEKRTEDKRPLFNWLDVIREKKIVYVGMDALTDNVVASAIGNAMLSDLVSVAGHLYNFGLDDNQNKDREKNKDNKNNKNNKNPEPCKKMPLPRICLHADEFNEVIGDEFIPLLNKARGAGFLVTAYTQTWSDVEARLDSIAKAGQAAGNLNTVIMFRTKEAKTVNMLLDQLPTVPILRMIPASVSQDSPQGEANIFYQSTNEDKLGHVDLKLIEQNDVLNLPKGQAFCLLEGGKLYKIRVPLPAKETISIPESIPELLQCIHQLPTGENAP